VTNRGNDRRQLFFQEADYQAVLEILSESARKIPVDLHGYNVMPNHLHLVVLQKETGAVSAYLQRALCGIARNHRFGTRTAGMGHVFQSRFWGQALWEARDYLIGLRYVEDNARRGGLVKRAENWPWGSLWERVTHGRHLLSEPLMELPPNWVELVNEGQVAEVLAALRKADGRGKRRQHS
jgi:putative transposase